MRWASLKDRLRAIWDSEAIHRQIDEEFRFHMDMRTADNVRDGMLPDEARREAERRFGPVSKLRELAYEARTAGSLDTFAQDVRQAVRVLLGNRRLATAAVITLAVAIGANTALFSVVHAVLLRPLPYQKPEDLTQIWENNRDRGWARDSVSPQNFRDWQALSRAFTTMAAYEYESFVLTATGAPERLSGVLASSTFFDVFGVRPALGRTFVRGDDQRQADRLVVLSDRLWRGKFATRADIVGKRIILDGVAHTVIGVMPPDFSFPSRRTDVWIAWIDFGRPRSDHFMYAVGRLATDAPLHNAQAEMNRIARNLEQQYPNSNAGTGITLVPLHEQITGRARKALVILLCAVGLMLLVAFANVTNMLLSHATARQKEFAVRTALGATRARLIRQVLTESGLLAIVAGGSGLVLSVWGVKLLVAASAGTIPRASEIRVDAAVLAFAFLLSLLTMVLVGITPALRFSTTDVQQSLKDGALGASAGARQRRVQAAFLVATIGLAFVLLNGATLFLRSYVRLWRIDPGFDGENVLTAQISLPTITASKYADDHRQAAFFDAVLTRIRALPGVQSAGAVNDLPFSGSRTGRSFSIEGDPAAPQEWQDADYRQASPDYFRTMNITILRGRDFTARDTANAAPVAVINKTLAKRFFHGDDPLGRRLVFSHDGQKVAREIIGVVEDIAHSELSDERAPEVYVPFTQHANSWMFLTVRGANARSLLPAVNQAVMQIDPNQPVHNVLPMQERLRDSIAPQRFHALVLIVLAATAVLLSAVGVHGLMSYNVAQRTREIGIRVAVGASKTDVLMAVVGRGVGMASAGLMCGLAVSLVSTRVVSSLLYGTHATEPLTTAVSAALIFTIALLACLLAARSALKIDPTVALRAD